MMKKRLESRTGPLATAAFLGACAGAAYHHESAFAPGRPSAADSLIGARARGPALAAAAAPDLPPAAGAPFQLGTAIATDASGRVHVAGLAAARPGESPSGLRAIVARLHPDGGYTWSRTCAGSGSLGEPRIAVSPAGDVLVALTFQGTVDCGLGPIVAAGGDDDFDGLVLRLDRAGRVAWIRTVSDVGVQVLASVALDPWGGAVVAGSFEGTIDLDGPPLTSESERDVLLARLDPDGDLVWQRQFGATGRSFGIDVDVSESGRVYLLARAGAAIDFGAGELPARRTSAFVTALDIDGRTQWSRSLGGSGEVFATGLSAAQGDRVVVAGGFTGTADFGAGRLASAGLTDVFVVKLGPSGEALWSERFGDAADQTAEDVVAGPGGRIALTGTFDGILDFGAGPLASGGGDVFVAKLTSTGRPLWSLRTGDRALTAGLGITFDGGGHVLATGALPYSATVDADAAPAAAAASAILFAARLDH